MTYCTLQELFKRRAQYVIIKWHAVDNTIVGRSKLICKDLLLTTFYFSVVGTIVSNYEINVHLRKLIQSFGFLYSD